MSLRISGSRPTLPELTPSAPVSASGFNAKSETAATLEISPEAHQAAGTRPPGTGLSGKAYLHGPDNIIWGNGPRLGSVQV